MASISYELQTQMYASKRVFIDMDEWFSAEALEIAVDLADSFSKRHLPPTEYFELLLTVFEGNLKNCKENESEGWIEAIYITKTKQAAYIK